MTGEAQIMPFGVLYTNTGDILLVAHLRDTSIRRQAISVEVR
jgi:hypothetical protein